jgi:GNAT superfamily N-acetyltransferase
MGFLCHVYTSTREEELAITGWSAVQMEAFLMMQFKAQHAHYQEHYPGAAFQVILREGQPIGRLYLDRWPTELRIVDIALLPKYRGQGIGTTILEAILSEGQRLGLPVSIHVERFNTAIRLYTRLGFRQIEDKGVHYLMEKTPDAG